VKNGKLREAKLAELNDQCQRTNEALMRKINEHYKVLLLPQKESEISSLNNSGKLVNKADFNLFSKEVKLDKVRGADDDHGISRPRRRSIDMIMLSNESILKTS